MFYFAEVVVISSFSLLLKYFPMNRFWLLIPVCFVLINHSSSFAQIAPYSPIDKKASSETKALYKNLHALAEKRILFGHQHATEYGHGWFGDSDRSDVK